MAEDRKDVEWGWSLKGEGELEIRWFFSEALKVATDHIFGERKRWTYPTGIEKTCIESIGTGPGIQMFTRSKGQIDLSAVFTPIASKELKGHLQLPLTIVLLKDSGRGWTGGQSWQIRLGGTAVYCVMEIKQDFEETV